MSTCTVLGMAQPSTVAAFCFHSNLQRVIRAPCRGWMGALKKKQKKNPCDFRGKAVCARQGSPLTLGCILVFFRLRHFSAHRSQFGCVIPDLDKNRNPFDCWLSSVKSLPQVPGAEIRVLWREKYSSQWSFHNTTASVWCHIWRDNGPWELLGKQGVSQLDINENIQLLMLSLARRTDKEPIWFQ